MAAVLDTPDFVPVSLVQQLIDRTRERLRQHEELLGTLERVQSSDPSDWTDVLRTVGLLRGLDAASPSTRHRFALSLSDLADRDVPFLVEAALSEPDAAVAASLRHGSRRQRAHTRQYRPSPQPAPASLSKWSHPATNYFSRH